MENTIPDCFRQIPVNKEVQAELVRFGLDTPERILACIETGDIQTIPGIGTGKMLTLKEWCKIVMENDGGKPKSLASRTGLEDPPTLQEEPEGDGQTPNPDKGGPEQKRDSHTPNKGDPIPSLRSPSGLFGPAGFGSEWHKIHAFALFDCTARYLRDLTRIVNMTFEEIQHQCEETVKLRRQVAELKEEIRAKVENLLSE